MHIDSYFSLSNCKLDDAEYVIYGIPYDATQSFKPGSRFAPTAIREASWNLEEYSQFFSFDLSHVKVCDTGNINCDGSFEDIVERTATFIRDLNSIPIAIGGEHTVSYAASKKFRGCYLAFDAHFDLRDEFDGSKFNHACTIRRIFENGSDIVIAGVRSGTAEEREFAERNGIEFLYSWQFEVNKLLKILDSYDKIYVSLDMDVFDPSFAPGVSTPEPFGIQPILFLQVIAEIADRVVGFDVVEVVPDENRITQTLAAKLIFEFIAARESKINR